MEITAQSPPRVQADREQLLRRVHAFAWVSAVAVCILTGGWINLQAPPPLDLPSDRIKALRAEFAFAVGDPLAATRLQLIVDRLPKDRPVLVVRDPSKGYLVLASQLLSYSAWPRPVIIRDFNGTALNLDPQVLNSTDFSAIMLCGPQLMSRSYPTKQISRLLQVVYPPSPQP